MSEPFGSNIKIKLESYSVEVETEWVCFLASFGSRPNTHKRDDRSFGARPNGSTILLCLALNIFFMCYINAKYMNRLTFECIFIDIIFIKYYIA
jgi:hypothetical protein